MNIIEKFIEKEYKKLRWTILISVILVIIIYNLIAHFLLGKAYSYIYLDLLITFLLSVIIIYFAFIIIEKKENQLKEQVDQLTDSYQYIGQINRKIDSLLDVDIASLDQSKNVSLQNSTTKIFSSLINILNAKAGLLSFNYKTNFKIFESDLDDELIKTNLEKIAKQNYNKLYCSFNKDQQKYFTDLNIADDFFKKFKIISKPIYMHDKDIAVMILLFDKEQEIEDRDLNIIRVFSFYLALNATFKPDFTVQKV
jgi:hypothetical protein